MCDFQFAVWRCGNPNALRYLQQPVLLLLLLLSCDKLTVAPVVDALLCSLLPQLYFVLCVCVCVHNVCVCVWYLAALCSRRLLLCLSAIASRNFICHSNGQVVRQSDSQTAQAAASAMPWSTASCLHFPFPASLGRPLNPVAAPDGDSLSSLKQSAAALSLPAKTSA